MLKDPLKSFFNLFFFIIYLSTSFSCIQELETNEPCTCMLIGSNYVIYGTSKFFTVDLKNYQKRGKESSMKFLFQFSIFFVRPFEFDLGVHQQVYGDESLEWLFCFLIQLKSPPYCCCPVLLVSSILLDLVLDPFLFLS